MSCHVDSDARCGVANADFQLTQARESSPVSEALNCVRRLMNWVREKSHYKQVKPARA